MLYDPRWGHRDVLTIENLIAWMETQDPNLRYNYTDPFGCVVARFLSHMRAERTCLTGCEIPHSINRALNTADQDNWSYGEALERLRREHELGS